MSKTIGVGTGIRKWARQGPQLCHQRQAEGLPLPRFAPADLVGTADEQRGDADGFCHGKRRPFARRRTLGEQELIQLRETGAPLVRVGQLGNESDEFVDFFASTHGHDAWFDFNRGTRNIR